MADLHVKKHGGFAQGFDPLKEMDTHTHRHTHTLEQHTKGEGGDGGGTETIAHCKNRTRQKLFNSSGYGDIR